MALDDGGGIPDDRVAGEDEMRRGLLCLKEILAVVCGRWLALAVGPGLPCALGSF